MLRGENILLRSLQYSDLDFLEKVENNKEYWQFGNDFKQYSRNDLAEYISNATTDIKFSKQYRFVIDLNSTPIGFIDLFDYKIESAGVGIIIVEDYRNKGFANEALNLLVEYAFFVLHVEKVYSKVKKDNLASIKLFTGCKFVLEKEKSDFQYFVKLAQKI